MTMDVSNFTRISLTQSCRLRFGWLGALTCALGLFLGTSSDANAQVPRGSCTLGKKAKLFKNPVGMAFLQKLETGAVVSLIEEAGTRWEVAVSDGTIGFLDSAWMNKVCRFSPPAKPAPSQLNAEDTKALENTQATAQALSGGPSTPPMPSQGGLGSMALLPIEGERLDKSLVKICSNLIAAHLSAVPDRTLVTSEEIGAMLNLEEQKMALNCDDASCMAEIGGALGVDELVRVSLGKLGSKLIISMSRILVAEAAVLGRSTIQIDNVEDYYDAGFKRAVAEIYNLELQAAPTPGAAPSAQARVAPTPSQNEMVALPAVASAATPTPWGSYLSMILGGAAVGAGTYFGLEAQSNADIANALEIGSQRAGQDAENQALIANVLYSVGGLGLVTGIYLWFSADDVETASLSKQSQPGLRLTGLDIAPLREGALVLVGGSY